MDPLKCELRCLKCKGGDAAAVYKCDNGYCPFYGTRISDKQLRSENPAFSDASPGYVQEIQEPSAVDNNFKPLYSVSVYETPDKPNKDNE